MDGRDEIQMSRPGPGDELEASELRRHFPVLARTVNGRDLVYLDNAATTQMPTPVIDAVCDYYRTSNASVHRGLYALAEASTLRYERARQTVADFIGAATAKSIVFTRGTTESINLAAFAWGSAQVGPGDRILVTAMEHHSNLIPWQQLCARQGAVLQAIPVLPDGTLDGSAVDRLLTPGVKLLAVTHASNVLGTVNPVRELARRAHAVGALILVDGAQSVPHMPLDVQALECDFLAFSGHKMCAPMGIGVLHARLELLEEMIPFMTGGEMIQDVSLDHAVWAAPPNRFEAGTPNVAGAVGLAAAMDYLQGLGMDRVHAAEQRITRALTARLAAEDGVRIVGTAPQRGGAVSFTVEGVHPHDIAQFADQQGVAIRAGHLCAQPLLRSLGLPSVSRASAYIYNTEAEIDPLLTAIRQARKVFCP